MVNQLNGVKIIRFFYIVRVIICHWNMWINLKNIRWINFFQKHSSSIVTLVFLTLKGFINFKFFENHIYFEIFYIFNYWLPTFMFSITKAQAWNVVVFHPCEVSWSKGITNIFFVNNEVQRKTFFTIFDQVKSPSMFSLYIQPRFL